MNNLLREPPCHNTGIAQNGEINMFRPELNIRRFNRSAVRLAMPEVPEEIFQNKLSELVDIDRSWVPTKEGSALYLRPFMFATDEFIGVKPSKSYKNAQF